MTPEQVPGFFDVGEGFIEGTIARRARRAVAARRSRSSSPGRTWPANTHKFTLRLGADLWWMIYVALRDIFLLQVFLGSFIFFYPDVVSGKDLPITGGLAAVCAFAVLLHQARSRATATSRWYRAQVVLLGLGATLYIVPYFLGVQVTIVRPDNELVDTLASMLVSQQNLDVALSLCYLSASSSAILGAGGGRSTTCARPAGRARRPGKGASPMSGDELASALTSGGSALAGPLRRGGPADPVVVRAGHALRAAVRDPLPAVADAPVRRRRLVAVLRPHPRRAADRSSLALSAIFLMPNLYIGLGLPMTGAARRRSSCSGRWWSSSSATRTTIRRAFRLVSGLLVIASVAVHRPADLRPRGRRPGRVARPVRTGLDPRRAERGKRRPAVVNDLAWPILILSLVLFGLTAAALFLRYVLGLGRSAPSIVEAPAAE